MNSFLSVIYFQTNSFSSEKLAGGLLLITPQKIWFEFSESKLKLVSTLSSSNHNKLLVHVLKAIDQKVNMVNQDLKISTTSLVKKDHIFTKDYLQYLITYSQGLLQFGDILPVAGMMNKAEFKLLFNQFVEPEKPIVEAPDKIKPFANWQIKLQNPLLIQRADIDYVLKPSEKLKGFYLDTTISIITKNGALYAGQMIDFNEDKKAVVNRIEEFTLAAYSLSNLARNEKWPTSNLEVLFVPPKKGSKSEDTFNQVYKNKPDLIAFAEEAKLDTVLDTILTTPHTPISKVLKELEAA